ncbi:hypothetical protein F5Y19DRAFT_471407 [Xylariaceae sp. FL1651]|nr:hypothetical protein F5Y19DRAFT_471407 [Xylariaceae sp. FL1651]
MAGKTTLRHVLSQQKPFIRCATTATKNTVYTKWPKLGKSVTIWDDFNLDNLNESYGHVLDFDVPERFLVGPPLGQALAGVVINTTEDICHLISWNDGLLRPSLQLAKSHLRLYPGIVLRHRHSTADKSVFAKIPNGPKKLLVDHVIALDDFLGRIWWLVLGGRVRSGAAEHLQLANICKYAQTRYGYIQTDEDLVVCCFSKNAENWKVAIMPIPWSRNGVDVLTTDLALWWLCMLAMSVHHNRAIVEEGEMIKINEWDVIYLDEERGWVRRHQYSNIEEPTSPPPPDYRTPSPGNAAAFAAGAGVHAFDWFNIERTNDAILGDLGDLDFHLT